MNFKSKIFLSASTALYVASSSLMAMDDTNAKTPPAKSTVEKKPFEIVTTSNIAKEGTQNLFKTLLSNPAGYEPEEIAVLKYFQKVGRSIQSIHQRYGNSDALYDSIQQLATAHARRELEDWEVAPIRLRERKGEEGFLKFMDKLVIDGLKMLDKGSTPSVGVGAGAGAGAGAAPTQESKGATESKKS